MWHHGHHHWGNYIPMMGGIVMLIFLGIIIWLVIYAIRKLSPDEKTSNVDSAVDILRQRYARGEIGVEEYRERLEELQDFTNKI